MLHIRKIEFGGVVANAIIPATSTVSELFGPQDSAEMSLTEATSSSAPTAASSGEAGVMEKASLEVKIDASTPQGPALYEAIYTRGGW